MSRIRGLTFSAISSFGGAAIDIVRIALLARYLSPGDFGAFAIALVVIGFCQLFSEGGVGNALVSKAEVSKHQAGNILNFNILLSGVVCAIALICTPFISEFYSAPVLNSVLPLIILAVPLSAISRIFQAVLQRDLNMESIARATIVSKIVGLGVAIGVAEAGLGIYALVWSTIAVYIVALGLMFVSASRSIKFCLTIEWREVKPIVSFSIYQLGEFLLNFFAKNFDVLLITKFLGAEVSGVYVVVKNLLIRIGDIIVSTFNRYFHPLIAKFQDDKQQLEAGYLCYFRSVTMCIALSYILMALNHSLFIDVLLGEKYKSAYNIAYLMAIWLTIRYCTAPIATLWLVRQKPQIGLYWNILVAIAIPLTVYMSYPYGLDSVIIGLTLTQVFFFVLSLYVSYLLAWRSSRFSLIQIAWASMIFLACLPLYLLVDTDNSNRLFTLFISLLGAIVLIPLVWKKQALFLGEKN